MLQTLVMLFFNALLPATLWINVVSGLGKTATFQV